MTGCATVPSVGDREFAAGNYAAAAAAYEEALRGEPRARTDPTLLLRLGLSYARPGTPVHDPHRAVAVLRELADRFPKSREAVQAMQLVPQIDHEGELEAAAAAASAELVQLRQALAHMTQQAQATEAAVKSGLEQVESLRATLAAREAELRRVRAELEQLKRIDLQRTP